MSGGKSFGSTAASAVVPAGRGILAFLFEQRTRHRVHVLHVLHAHRDGVLDVLRVPEHAQADGVASSITARS